MKKLVLAVVFVFIMCNVAQVLAQGFSADMISTANGQTMTAKIYASEYKSRVETADSIIISRPDKKVAWILMPSQKQYMEQEFDPSKMAASARDVAGEIERVNMGKETVGGVAADKYKVTYDFNGVTNSLYQWIDPSKDLPVKSAAVDGSWTVEYKNIRVGSQPDSLFELPDGYSKFSMPDMNKMMGDMQ